MNLYLTLSESQILANTNTYEEARLGLMGRKDGWMKDSTFNVWEVAWVEGDKSS